MSDDMQLVAQPHSADVPAVMVSETALLDSGTVDDGIWVVFPGEEPHWELEDWATEAVEGNVIPWWIFAIWGVFMLWMVWYLVYGSSHW